MSISILQGAKVGASIHPTNLALTQVAVIAALCCVGHIGMVCGGGGCSCMLHGNWYFSDFYCGGGSLWWW